jgi:hypothetical protein
METLKTKTLVYDNNCPMCTWYTGKMVNAGLIESNVRVPFEQLDLDNQCLLDLKRARHEIPMIDQNTGEVLYGLDALTIVFANSYPILKPVITRKWFKTGLKPLYYFISYNRRVIAGGAPENSNAFSFAPDFNLGWRLALIAVGFGYTALCIYVFALLMALNPMLLLACVTVYFLLLLAVDLAKNKTREMQWDYMAHLGVLGLIEGTLFVLAAILARLTGLTGLMFAGQGAGRLLAIWLHAKRVKNNHYAKSLNYAFAFGAIALVVLIAVFKNQNLHV